MDICRYKHVMSEHTSENLSEHTLPAFDHAMAATTSVCVGGKKEDAGFCVERLDNFSSFCPRLDEEGRTVAVEAGSALEGPSTTTKVEGNSNGTLLETISFCSDFCPWLDEEWAVDSDAGTASDEHLPEDTEEDDTPAPETRGSRWSRVRAFFKRVWKAIKKPFLRRTRVEPQTPPGMPVPWNSLESVSGESGSWNSNDSEDFLRVSGSWTSVDSDLDSESFSGESGSWNSNDSEDFLRVSGSWTSVDSDLDSESFSGVSGSWSSVDSNPDSESFSGESGSWTSVDSDLDSESFSGVSGSWSSVDSNPDSESFSGVSGSWNSVDLDPESVPGVSLVQNSVDSDPESVPGVPVIQNSVDSDPESVPVIQNSVDSDPESVPGVSVVQNSVDSDPESLPGVPVVQNSVDSDPESVPGVSVVQNSVDSDPESVPGVSVVQNSVDSDPESVPGVSVVQNSVDSDPESLPGVPVVQNSVDSDPESLPGAPVVQNSVDPDPEPVPGVSVVQNFVDPDPEPVSGVFGPWNTVDSDSESIPGVSELQNSVVPDPEPVPEASGLQNTFGPDSDPAPGPSWLWDTVNPEPEFVLEGFCYRYTGNQVPEPEVQNSADLESEPVPGPSGLQETADVKSSSALGFSKCDANTAPLHSLYSFGKVLGSGSFGTTYRAVRKSDGKEVAIKKIPKRMDDRHISAPGCSKPAYKEAAYMLILKDPTPSIYLIELYEWFDQEGFISLVMEYPKPCVSLLEYVKSHGRLTEEVARYLLHQLVQAVVHCIDHGISHNDMHEENILVNTETLDLKLIDFGCASKIREDQYVDFIRSSVVTLGYLLNYMVNAKALLYSWHEETNRLQFNPNLSSECCDLIEKCVEEHSWTLEDILQHEWMKKLLMKRG
ncbi:uncharacterized protein isoform X2 [Danio rerio]|uniref:Uncharacterized protein isoform X2 n=1 Tax=Danio rerio TaxID=7955 RepID=A0AC58IHN6_DANRE